MPRIIIAGASYAGRAQLNRLLAASGFGVFRLCASSSELRRALNTCDDGLVVLLGSVPDCPPDELAEDFGSAFQFLLIARPDVLSRCASPRIFKLTYPCPGSAVLGAVEMLCQLHAMRLPKRSGREKALVERAKELLMASEGLSEPEAQRRMQQYAMRHGMKMEEYAAALLGRDADEEDPQA